jgi:quercetin dioxygenase-like cupin family protein
MTTITTPAAEPYVSHQGEARWYGDSLFEFLVPDDVTDGKLTVFRATLAKGFSPPRHIHIREDEVFLVLDGDVTFDIDGRLRAAAPARASTCRARWPTRSGSTARARCCSGS